MLMLSAALSSAGAAGARGPLRVCKQNPRYFADSSGKPVYLTGAHTWSNLKDMGPTDPPAKFDYAGYLDFLVQRHHNFIRLWTWELTRYGDGSSEGTLYAAPFPWPRTGPGEALDGKPKFDLSRLDEAYFRRLHERVAAAGKRGLYVSIMLFEGWGLQFANAPWRWDGHPFNHNNNINGIDGDANGDGKGLEIDTLEIPAVTRIQEAYVSKVVDAVNDLDNVLYEISNEAGPYSTEWQYHMIRFVKQCEASKRKQHPVGMTFQYEGGSNETLMESPADWMSPNPSAADGYSYQDNPPPADGRKVILSDTDHLWGIGGNQAWVWKSFCRGLNPLFMDPYLHDTFYRDYAGKLNPQWDPVRNSLGYTRRFAQRMNLAKTRPAGELASTGYCLAQPGVEYVVYLPEGGSAKVDLSAAKGELAVEWFNPSTGDASPAPAVAGGAERELTSPFAGDAVLYVHRR